jgi:hypothetical protein
VKDRGRITFGWRRRDETLEEQKVKKGPGPGYAGGNGLARGSNPWRRAERMSQDIRCANVTRGWKPVTATDPREGKPLKTDEPHGRYRVKVPERSEEEQVAGAVENGVSGTTAGGGKAGAGGLFRLQAS